MIKLLEKLSATPQITHSTSILLELLEATRFAEQQEIGTYELMDIALSGEGELGVVVIEQSKLLHVKPESDEIAEKLLLVEEPNEEQRRRQIDALEVLTPVICEEETLVEMGQKCSAILPHEMHVFAARVQRVRVEVELAQVGLISRGRQVIQRLSRKREQYDN